MSNEIKFTASLTAYKPSVMSSAISRSVSDSTFTMSSNVYVQQAILVGTSATVIPLGQVTSPHWCYFKNLDATNFITIRNGASGADLIKMRAGESAFFPMLDSSVPYAVANTASCLMEYLIIGL